MAFLYHSDLNRDNVEMLLQHHESPRRLIVFSGTVNNGKATWGFIQKRHEAPRRGSYPSENVIRLRESPNSSLYRVNKRLLCSPAIDWTPIEAS